MTPTGYISDRPIHLRRIDDVAALIKTRREALGWSQQALADRLTVSRKWVNEIERGNSNAKLGLVLRALNELDIDLVGQACASPGARAMANPVDEIDIDAIADRGLPSRRRAR